MKPDERLVFGHTHGPFINKDKTVVNTGPWVNELINPEYQNSYVEMGNGIIELKFFKARVYISSETG
jgi:predicted phosphodiesterase